MKEKGEVELGEKRREPEEGRPLALTEETGKK